MTLSAETLDRTRHSHIQWVNPNQCTGVISQRGFVAMAPIIHALKLGRLKLSNLVYVKMHEQYFFLPGPADDGIRPPFTRPASTERPGRRHAAAGDPSGR